MKLSRNSATGSTLGKNRLNLANVKSFCYFLSLCIEYGYKLKISRINFQMESLSKIFGGEERVRIMRMFLFNSDSIFGVDDISNRTGVSGRTVLKELEVLEKSGMLRRKPFPKIAKDSLGKRRLGNDWITEKNFPYFKPLENLLIQQSLIGEDEIIKRLSRVAKLKLLVIAGIFIQDQESRVDLLLVGDNFRRASLDRIIKSFEAEIGREVRFTVFDTGEFNYRMGMYEKFLRDIFKYLHKLILDKLHSK